MPDNTTQILVGVGVAAAVGVVTAVGVAYWLQVSFLMYTVHIDSFFPCTRYVNIRFNISRRMRKKNVVLAPRVDPSRLTSVSPPAKRASSSGGGEKIYRKFSGRRSAKSHSKTSVSGYFSY